MGFGINAGKMKAMRANTSKANMVLYRFSVILSIYFLNLWQYPGMKMKDKKSEQIPQGKS